MRIHPSYLVLLGAFALVGCPGPESCPAGMTGTPPLCTPIITIDGGPDTGGSMVDTGGTDAPRPDAPPATCGAVGAMGGHCRMGACGTPAMCRTALGPTTGGFFSLRTGFGLAQGMGPADANGFYEEVPDSAAVPADDIPIPMASGTLCTQDCDSAAMTDTCGACATCDQSIGTIGLLATSFLYGAEGGPFGDDTGWCRADCTFNPAEAGATCPTGTALGDNYTCNPGTNTCVEGCVNDTECQWEIVNTREGFGVTVIDRSAGAPTCNPTTHRCEWTNADTETVGDACERSSECAEDVGLCLRGGTCAEYQCNTAADTVPDDDVMGGFVCDGGAGICLGNGGNNGTLCIDGCNTAADCVPGNACVSLELPAGAAIGPYTGYCLGICDSRLDDVDGSGPLTSTDDRIIACGAGYQCDYPASTADDLDPTGSCRETCAVDADCTGEEGNYCDIVPGSGSPGYGFCRWLDQGCNYLDLSDDCYGDQVCDLLAWPENPGICVEPCTDAAGANPCEGGDVCLPGTGAAPRNVCRTPCTAGGAECETGETCLMGYCEQLTMT